MAIDTAQVLDDIRFFSGDRLALRYDLTDADAAAADSETPPPMDLYGLVVHWSLARVVDGSTWLADAEVDLSSDMTEDQVDIEPSELLSAVVAAGGSGYVVGDVLKVLGGDGMAATVRVATVSGGAVLTVTVEQAGLYATAPTNPASTKLGANQTCTLTLTTAAKRGAVLVRTLRSDTENLIGDFHEELEVVDDDGEGKVVAIRNVRIDQNVRNA